MAAFRDHGRVTRAIPRDGEDCEGVLADFRKAGIDLLQLASDLQSQGARSFTESWDKLLQAIESKRKESAIPS